MEPRIRIRTNWFTRTPYGYGWNVAFLFSALLFTLAALYLNGAGGTNSWMPASGESVFGRREYYRLWTTLFAHGDLGHLLGNALLFVPLAFHLSAHFGFFVFPLFAIVLGGLTNLIVLKTLPPATTLIGMSGVVYWMGAAWLTLFLLLDRRERIRRRLGVAVFLFFMLFVPEKLSPEVSYLSHIVGFASGTLSALALYGWNRKTYEAAEVRELIPEPIETDDELTQLALAAAPAEECGRLRAGR